MERFLPLLSLAQGTHTREGGGGGISGPTCVSPNKIVSSMAKHSTPVQCAAIHIVLIHNPTQSLRGGAKAGRIKKCRF